MNKKNLLIFVVVVLIILVLYFVFWNFDENTNSTLNEDENTELQGGAVLGSAEEIEGGDPQLIEYRSSDYGFSFIYPDALFDLELADNNEGLVLIHPEMLIIFAVVDGEAPGTGPYEFNLPNNRYLDVTIDSLSQEELSEDVQAAIFNQVVLSIEKQ